jgi:hypothetical protein
MNLTRSHVAGIAVLVLALLAAAVFFLLPSSHSAGDQRSAGTTATSIQAPSFTAPVPGGWTVRAQSNSKGAHQFQLGSTKAPINGVGIGPAGTVAVTVTEYGLPALARGRIAGKPASSYSPVALLPFVVGQPARAEGVQVGQHPKPTVLAGAQAGEEAFFYGYHGHENLQVDVIAKRNGHLFLVELDAEPQLQAASKAALSQVLGGWRFR